MASIVPKLVEIVEHEWQFFGAGQINLDGTSVDGRKEYADGVWQRVGDYWKFIGGAYANLTGKDRGQPWSAAFVSFCMSEAGAGDNFPYSAGHATYINAAIRNASGPADAPIIGRQFGDHVLKPGDLIGYWRGGTKVRFDTARKIGWYQSHCDIVTEVGQGRAYSIGGNVANSVTRREVRLNSDGKLTDRSQNWFVVLQNNM